MTAWKWSSLMLVLAGAAVCARVGFPSAGPPYAAVQEEAPKPAPQPAQVVGGRETAAEEEPYDIREHAFPPTLSDAEWHHDAWLIDDCLRCHETGVGDATRVRHRNMPPVLLTAKCRSCHVQIPGSEPVKPAAPAPVEGEPTFSTNAFPPMMPASASHTKAWTKDDCLLCHETGIKGAPVTRHEGLPEIYRKAKCRTCHVQVRAVEASQSSTRPR